MPVKQGDTVKIEYEGISENGTVFSSSKMNGKPLTLEIGAEQVVDELEGMIEGLEEALIGMEKGEEKEINLRLSEWYGEHDPQLVRKIPRSRFPEEKELKPGMVLKITRDLKLLDERPWEYTAWLTEVTEETVTVDFNHFLAGKTLKFKIKVIDIVS